jgi:hypothetical protein
LLPHGAHSLLRTGFSHVDDEPPFARRLIRRSTVTASGLQLDL